MRGAARGRALALLLAFLAASGARGGTTGVLRGSVRDADGKEISGASIRIESPALKEGSLETHSDRDGAWSFLALPPGSYVVAADRPPLPAFRQAHVAVRVDSVTTLDPILGLATMEVEVDVRAQGLVDPSKQETSTAVSGAVLEELPIVGRSYSYALMLAPGAVADPFGTATFRPNVHGARDSANQFYFDGANTTSANGGGQGTLLNMDAIEQMEIVTAGYRAELGRSDGAIANALLKSGGNDFSGTFRVDYRDLDLDERGSGKPDYGENESYRHYFSLTLGGPVVRDRLWFFASALYEDRVDLTHFEGAVYEYSEEPSTNQDYLLKLSYQIDDENQLAFSYHRQPLITHNADAGFGNVSPEAHVQYEADGAWYHLREVATITPTLLLESTLFAMLDYEAEQGPDEDAPAPTSRFHGQDDDTGTIVGRETSSSRSLSDRWQLKEDVSWYVDAESGSHDLKAGIDLQREISEAELVEGEFYFLKGGVPYRKTYLPDDPILEIDAAGHSDSIALYVQDSWSPRPGLTLNGGLRADYQRLPYRGSTGLDRLLADPTFENEDRTIDEGEIDALGISPRLGLTWVPGGDGRNVLRASAGRIYSTLYPGFAVVESGTLLTGRYRCDTDPEGNCLGESEPKVFEVAFVDRDATMPYTDEVTLGYEREVGEDKVLGATAIWRRGRELLQGYEVNHTYTDRDGDGFPETKDVINPNFENVFVYGNHDRMDYHALELTFRKELSSRWQLLSSYVYSVAKGDAASAGSSTGDDARLLADEYGYLDYDQRHVVKLDGSYLVPGDVLLTASARYYSGLPYSIIEKNYYDENGNGIYDLGEVAGSGDHYIGEKNAHRSPSRTNLDLRVEKELVWKGVAVGLFATVVNVLNQHPIVKTLAFMPPYAADCDSINCTDVPGTIKYIESRDFGRQFQLGLRVAFGGGGGGSLDTDAPREPRDASPAPRAAETSDDGDADAAEQEVEEDGEAKKGPADATYKVKRRTLVGTVESLDRESMTMTVDMGLGRFTLVRYDSLTTISGGALAPGKKVRVKLSLETTTLRRATSIKVLD